MQAPAKPASLAVAETQTEDEESEPQRQASAQQETQTAAVEDLSTEDALRAENEQLLVLARKQDAMLAGLQTDLEVSTACLLMPDSTCRSKHTVQQLDSAHSCTGHQSMRVSTWP